MAASKQIPSYLTCVADALSQAVQPLTMDELIASVERRRPISKGVRNAVYRALSGLYQAVSVAPGEYGWLSHLLAGTVYRHPLASDEMRRGYLLLDELEHAVLFPQFFQMHRRDGRTLSIDLFGGPAIAAEANIERKTWSLRLGVDFSEWLDDQGGQGKDDLLITVADAVAGRYGMRLLPREARDEERIERRNVDLALLAEEIVAEDRRMRSVMPTWELAARLVARGFFADSTPPDDLHYALHQFSVLRFVDGVGYAAETSLDGTPGGRHDLSRIREFYNSPEDFLTQPDLGVEHMDSLAEGHGEEYGDDLSEDDLDDSCVDYNEYLDSFHAAAMGGEPLLHDDYHLLEAELETLVALEHEFGRLLADQLARKEELAQRLFIDPESFMGDDMDMTDGADYEDPPFWEN